MSETSFIFGMHAVLGLLSAHPKRILRLVILANRQDKKIQAVITSAAPHRIHIEFVSRHDLDRMTSHANHQGVVAFCHPAKRIAEADLTALLETIAGPSLLLVLDGVQDPHNLGACLRTADAAGVHAVIAPKDKSVGLTAAVAKVAEGAAETVPFIQVTNLARTLRLLQERNIWIFGADHAAEKTLYQADFRSGTALVLGAEGTGLRRLTREHCDVLLKIPLYGSVASLNVSVAAGIFLFEAVRQRFKR